MLHVQAHRASLDELRAPQVRVAEVCPLKVGAHETRSSRQKPSEASLGKVVPVHDESRQVDTPIGISSTFGATPENGYDGLHLAKGPFPSRCTSLTQECKESLRNGRCQVR